MLADVPEQKIAERGGAVKWRTVRVGKGRSTRYLRVAIVRKKGPRGGQTVAGPARKAAGNGTYGG